MKKSIPVIYILFILVYTGCKKKEEVSLAPTLEFIEITPSVAVELEDEITLRVKYTDENGDLGENNSEVKNLFVLDTRNGVEYSFRVQQLAPTGAEISIEGSLSINIKTMVITDESLEQTATFSVYMNDQAKNKSNIITTTPITIIKTK